MRCKSLKDQVSTGLPYTGQGSNQYFIIPSSTSYIVEVLVLMFVSQRFNDFFHFNASILNQHPVACVRFKVYMAVKLKNTVLWNVLP